MSTPHFEALLRALCEAVDLPDADTVVQSGTLRIEDFEVLLAEFESDPQAIYLHFDFGIVTAGRTMSVFQLLLESNTTVYAQDQAQVGLHPETGTILLIIRVPLLPEVDGPWLADLIAHYVEHGRYWRDNMLSCSDAMYEGLCAGNYQWLKA